MTVAPSYHAVRAAIPSDIDAIARIQVQSWQEAYRGQIPDEVLAALNEQTRAARWRELLGQAGHRLRVAIHEHRVVGFCSLIRSRDSGASDDTGEIAAIYVDPSRWRRGAGNALIEDARQVARELGYRRLTLWVLSTNTLGRAFYARMGFAPDGESKLDVRDGYSLAEVRYQLDL